MAYNASLHTATNKSIGLTGKPVDARSYYYDTTYFKYRPYVSTSEAIGYLVGSDRIGQFTVIVNTGGSLLAGVITGGINTEWWWKDGVLDVNLVERTASSSLPVNILIPADISEDMTINWQTDIVPEGYFTYVQRFGNSIPPWRDLVDYTSSGKWEDGSGTLQPYWIYADDEIQSLTIPFTFEAGLPRKLALS